MIWKYLLIGLIMGIIIGAITMQFYNRKLRKQQTDQHELETSRVKLNEYYEELTNYFSCSAKLLDNIIKDHHQLYRYMSKKPNSLLLNQHNEDDRFQYRLTEADNDQIPVEMQQDYSKKS